MSTLETFKRSLESFKSELRKASTQAEGNLPAYNRIEKLKAMCRNAETELNAAPPNLKRVQATLNLLAKEILQAG